MRVTTFAMIAVIAALPLNAAFAGDTTVAGDKNCGRPSPDENPSETDKGRIVVHLLISGGWIMGWLSAANRTSKADWLAGVRPEHVTELIDKLCRDDNTVEQAGLAVLGQLRMEYAARKEYKRQTGKDAPQE